MRQRFLPKRQDLVAKTLTDSVAPDDVARRLLDNERPNKVSQHLTFSC